MWDFYHHSPPASLASMFTRRDEVNNRNLRDKNKNKLYTAHRFNNKYGYDSFSQRGSLLLNKLKDLRKFRFTEIVFQNQHSWPSLKPLH